MASTELCVRRLKRELQALIKSPIDGVEVNSLPEPEANQHIRKLGLILRIFLHPQALPLETNLREWHFVLKGQVGTPYEGGFITESSNSQKTTH